MVTEKNQDTAELVSQVLLNNGIVIIPTDTIYGFSCLPGPAEQRLRELKGRGAEKHFLRLALKEQLHMLTPQLPEERFLSLWPGPLTLIMNSHEPGTTTGIRVPDNKFLQEILGKTGAPVISSSVNLSGMPAMNDIKEIIAVFEDKVDLIVDGGTLPESAPSTIADITVNPFRILRQGAMEIKR